MRLCLSLAIVFFVGCSTNNKKNESRAEAYFQIGTTNLVKGNYPLALANLLEAKRLNPKNAVIRNNLGLAYFVRQRYSEAEEHLSEALRLHPKYTDARNNLGRLYIEIGKYDLAIKELTIAANDLTYITPEKILSNLGLAHFKSGNFERAKNTLLKAIKIKRDDCYNYNYYGRSLFELKDYNLATQALDQAVRLCSEAQWPEPGYFAGLAYMKLSKYSEAESRFNEVVSLYPDTDYATKSKKALEKLQ